MTPLEAYECFRRRQDRCYDLIPNSDFDGWLKAGDVLRFDGWAAWMAAAASLSRLLEDCASNTDLDAAYDQFRFMLTNGMLPLVAWKNEVERIATEVLAQREKLFSDAGWT